MRTIVKLGGSSVTQKQRLETLNEDIIRICIDQIAHSGIQNDPLILVHGAGSFGHFHAKEAGLASSAASLVDCLSASRVRNSVAKLCLTLSDGFVAAGIPIAVIHPGNLVALDATGEFDFSLLLAHVERFLELGFVPLLHGDLVLANGQGRILSGDLIMTECARRFLPQQVAFFTNVDGVLDENAKLVQELSAKHEIATLARASGADVSGGMAGKVAAARSIKAMGNIEVYILRAGSSSSLQFLQNKPVSIGTRLLY